jgi:hypothetical protein
MSRKVFLHQSNSIQNSITHFKSDTKNYKEIPKTTKIREKSQVISGEWSKRYFSFRCERTEKLRYQRRRKRNTDVIREMKRKRFGE